MKKMLLLAIVAAMTLLTMACSKDDLQGTWQLMNEGDAYKVVNLVIDEDTIEYYNVTMAYSLKGNQMLVEFTPEKTSTWTFKVKDDVLTLTIDGSTLKYQRVKTKKEK